MKNITTSVCGVEIPVSDVPETLEELITAAGGEANVVNGFNNYIRFHRTNTEARSALSEAVEEITGIARKTRKATDKAGKETEEWDETESEHINSARAQVSDFAAKVPDILAKVGVIKYSAQGATRTGGPKKVAQVYTKAAQQLMEDPNKAENAVKILESKNPGTTVARDESGKIQLESLAAALKVNKERVEAEANAALGLVE